MGGLTSTNTSALKKLVDEHPNWYHQIELAPGIVTPGGHASSEGLKVLDIMGLPQDASGLRV
ncbi:MAG: hypothetical protein ABI451_10740, partial [Dokdonella sp.]